MKWTPSTDDDRSGKRRLVRWLLVALAAGMIILGIQQTFQRRSPIAPPGGGPDTAAPNQPAGRAEKHFATVDEGLKLSDDEKQKYLVAFGRNGQIDDSALTMWLSHVRRMPRLDEPNFQRLDRPAPANLLDKPDKYAGEAIQLVVAPIAASKLIFTPTADWTVYDGPVWRLDCLAAVGDKADLNQPLMVLCTFDPKAVLGEPRQVTPEGEEVFQFDTDALTKPRLCRLAGVFYKLHRRSSRDGETRQYPVILCWQIEPAGTSLRSPVPGSAGMLILGVLILLVGLFVFIKRRARMGQRAAAQYEPLREEEQPAPPIRPAEPAEPTEEDRQVDADLKAAAEAFRKERDTGEQQGRGADDAQDHPR